MRRNIVVLGLVTALLTAGLAQADSVTLSFQNSTLSGTPGTLLQFFGTATNNSLSDQYLNSIDFNGFTSDFAGNFDPTPFFNIAYPLPANTDSGLVELFDLSIPTVPAGLYNGSVTVVGGLTSDATDLLTTTNFSVQVQDAGAVTPEPATFVLVAIGVAGIGWMRRRRRAESE